MKNILFAGLVSLLLILGACSKRKAVNMEEPIVTLNYDTTAIDSFSPGAVSVDIARKIRESSPQYKDSVKQALKLQQEEKKLREELEKESKKKQEEEKKMKEKQEVSPVVNTQ
ncbi:hypothetical protein [Chryseobacterium sp.]|uniref:hypothetical protein n=1 Tax=Chryseobacterium sp. TaxID=1871047 RepID=UPI0025BD9448|nr:hypothetical protein [Chryseobacterium sp.]